MFIKKWNLYGPYVIQRYLAIYFFKTADSERITVHETWVALRDSSDVCSNNHAGLTNI